MDPQETVRGHRKRVILEFRSPQEYLYIVERPFGPPVAVKGKFLGPALFERQGLPVGPYKMLLLRAIRGCLDCLGRSGLLF